MTNINNHPENITNLDYLLSLSKGNTQFVKEMIDIFLIENPKEVESLEKAVGEKNFEAIKHAAHFLQSSIPFVGLDKIIQNEVYEIEKTAMDKSDIKKIEQLFLKVQEACKKAREELLKSRHIGQPV